MSLADDITSMYLSNLGRAPDATELASEIDNANRYSLAGIERQIQLRGSNSPGSGVRGDEFLSPLTPAGGPASNGNGGYRAMLNADSTSRDLIASVATGGVDDAYSVQALQEGGDVVQPEGALGDFFRGVVGLIPGVGPIISGLLPGGGGSNVTPPTFPRLPAPPNRPALPPAGGTRPPITIPIPSRGGGAMTAAAIAAWIARNPGKAASIAAVAAALGISLEQYIATYGIPKKSRHMNVLNPKALHRSLRRAEGFEKFAKKVLNFTCHTNLKQISRKRRGRRGHRVGCGCVACRGAA